MRAALSSRYMRTHRDRWLQVNNIVTANESGPEASELYFTKYPAFPNDNSQAISFEHPVIGLGTRRSMPQRALWSSRLLSCDLVPVYEFKKNEHHRVPEHFVFLNSPVSKPPLTRKRMI